MTINFIDTGKVKITIYGYVDNMIRELPTEMISKSMMPASNHLFEHRENEDTLPTPKLSKEFHRLVAKTLFLSKKVRSHLKTAVASNDD